MAGGTMGSGRGATIGIFDRDDPDLKRLFSKLSEVVPTKTVVLGLDDRCTDVVFDPPDFSLTQGDVTVTRADFEAAPLVVFRRWCFSPGPTVRSTLEDADHRQFAEREWDALLISALLEFESDGPQHWANPPSSLALARNKLWLMRMAMKAGFEVPPFAIANHLAIPQGAADAGVVCKAINEYELIGSSMRYPTTTVAPDFLATNTGKRAGCPSLLQRKVNIDHEVRVFVWFGEIIAAKLETTSDYSDIRFTKKGELSSSETDVPAPICRLLGDFAELVGLNYAAFDFLVEDGRHFLVDVTPSGLWSPFEFGDECITARIVEQIERRTSEVASAR